MNIGPYHLNENEEMLSAIEKAFHKYFRKSLIKVYIPTMLGNKTDIMVSFTLGKDKSEWINGIYNNDPIHTGIWLRPLRDGKWKAERSQGGSVWIPSENRMKAYDTIKVWKRDWTVAGEQKVIQKFDAFFKDLYNTVKDNADKIKVPFDVKSKL